MRIVQATAFTLWERPKTQLITAEYLRQHPTDIFVFGDNLEHRGTGGAAALRTEPNTYGFVTKKAPDNKPESFFTVEEYKGVFQIELAKLEHQLIRHYNRRFLISKLGGGLANKHGIWEAVVKPQLATALNRYGDQVLFLWELPLL